jgi:hypothetical protein
VIILAEINGIPKTERIWTHITTKSGENYYITSKADKRDFYFLYKMDGDTAVKLGKSRSPAELEGTFIK